MTHTTDTRALAEASDHRRCVSCDIAIDLHAVARKARADGDDTFADQLEGWAIHAEDRGVHHHLDTTTDMIFNEDDEP